MKLNLGLENLKTTQICNNRFDMIDWYESYIDLQEASVKFDAAISTYENVLAVRSVVKKCGYTKAIESLIGHDTVQIAASTEGLKEAWDKFIQWLKNLWAKIKAFVMKFFVNADNISAKLRERYDECKKAGGNAAPETEVKIPLVTNELLTCVNFALPTVTDTYRKVVNILKTDDCASDESATKIDEALKSCQLVATATIQAYMNDVHAKVVADMLAENPNLNTEEMSKIDKLRRMGRTIKQIFADVPLTHKTYESLPLLADCIDAVNDAKKVFVENSDADVAIHVLQAIHARSERDLADAGPNPKPDLVKANKVLTWLKNHETCVKVCLKVYTFILRQLVKWLCRNTVAIGIRALTLIKPIKQNN